MGDEEDNPPQCHCQAGRLVIIVGDSGDSSIGAALQWVDTGLKANHVHRVAFQTGLDSTPHLTNPLVPDGKGGWKDFQKGDHKDAVPHFAASEFKDCCHFEEVVIIAHGGQVGLYSSLADELPMLIDRPVLKLVFWVCGGSRENYPFTDSGRHKDFLRICQLVRPPEYCPCGCHHEDCYLRDADGKPAGKCPSKSGTTTVLSAGYYTAKGKTVPSKLGLKPSDPNPFGAPDGTLIQTTVTRGAGASIDTNSTAVTGQSVLGTPVRTDDSLKDPDPGGYGFDPAKKIGPDKVTAKPKAGPAPYQGPRAGTACPHKDGCIPGR